MKFKLFFAKLLLKLGLVKTVFYINGSEKLPPPLSAEEENMLLLRNSNSAKDRLIVHNLRLVVYIAKKFDTSGVGIEDLVSIGTIGLIKAVNTFSADRNIKLATYASRCIENEILMYFRSTKKITAEVSLEDTIGKDKDDNTITLQDVLENSERNIEDEVDLKIKIKKLYQTIKGVLKDREKLIIELRFGLDGEKPKTQHEIAQMMGISRSYVSRIETKAIRKISKGNRRIENILEMLINNF